MRQIDCTWRAVWSSVGTQTIGENFHGLVDNLLGRADDRSQRLLEVEALVDTVEANDGDVFRDADSGASQPVTDTHGDEIVVAQDGVGLVGDVARSEMEAGLEAGFPKAGLSDRAHGG